MRLNQRRLDLAARIAFWLLAGVTLCAALATLWWGFELFVHFRVQYLFAGVALAVALWVLRRRLMALLALALSAVHAVVAMPMLFAPALAAHDEAPSSIAGAGPSAAPLRVLSINVFGANREYDKVFAYVRAERPDVLILLEVTPQWSAALQRDLQSEFAYSWVIPTGMRAGMAMLSRATPRAARVVDLGSTAEPSLLLTLDRPGGPVTVLGTHLYWPLGPDHARVRNGQLASIARIAREVREPLLVAGDLNVSPFSPYFAALLRDSGLRPCNGGRLTPTWPARVPVLYIQIDHCLVSAGLAVQRFDTGPYVSSDHYPIVMEVRARGAPQR